MKKSAPPPCDGGANARKGGGRQPLAPPWQPEIGPQHRALDPSHGFNVRHALDRDALPLRDCAGRDAEAARQFSPRACGLDGGGKPCVKFFRFHAWQISHTKNACQVQKCLTRFFRSANVRSVALINNNGANMNNRNAPSVYAKNLMTSIHRGDKAKAAYFAALLIAGFYAGTN